MFAGLQEQRRAGIAQQQSALAELFGGMAPQAFGGFGGLAQQQAMQQQPIIKFRRYDLPLTFIDKLRAEIDNWLKS